MKDLILISSITLLILYSCDNKEKICHNFHYETIARKDLFGLWWPSKNVICDDKDQ